MGIAAYLVHVLGDILDRLAPESALKKYNGLFDRRKALDAVEMGVSVPFIVRSVWCMRLCAYSPSL